MRLQVLEVVHKMVQRSFTTRRRPVKTENTNYFIRNNGIGFIRYLLLEQFACLTWLGSVLRARLQKHLLLGHYVDIPCQQSWLMIPSLTCWVLNIQYETKIHVLFPNKYRVFQKVGLVIRFRMLWTILENRLGIMFFSISTFLAASIHFVFFLNKMYLGCLLKICS